MQLGHKIFRTAHKCAGGVILIIILLLSAKPFSSQAQMATVTVNSEADAFVRAANPTGNYGGAGAIAVSGPAAVNGANQGMEHLTA